jgi:DNA invertase Pin-like site-specific DNA recombinase
MKAVIYTRASSKEQEREGYSIPAQLNKCRELATKEGYEVVQEFIDVESAKQPGRTNFNKMIEFIKGDSIDTIICHKVDRLCRNFKDYVTIDDLKVKPLFVEEEFPDNAAGKLTFGLKVLLAKHYIDNLSDEVKKSLNQKLAQDTIKQRMAKAHEDKLDGILKEELWQEKSHAWQSEID